MRAAHARAHPHRLTASERAVSEVNEAPRLNLLRRWLNGCGRNCTFFMCGSDDTPGQLACRHAQRKAQRYAQL
eukprot:4582110-Pleurochrysis_carterae.AAC.1